MRSIEKIGADLLRDMGRAVKHDLYAIGNADAVRCQPDCGDVPSREVMQILKLGTNGRYDPASTDPEFGKKVRNNDLPNLRADRVASVLSGFLNGEPVLILENGASEAKGSKFRTAEIVLFVPW